MPRLTLVTEKTPSAFIGSPESTVRKRGAIATKNPGSSNVCFKATMFGGSTISNGIKSESEDWTLTCEPTQITNNRTLSATGVQQVDGSYCGPAFHGDGAASYTAPASGDLYEWYRRAHKGVLTDDDGNPLTAAVCTKPMVGTAFAECACPAHAEEEEPTPPGEPSPIVIDLYGNGFDLTGAEDPVAFDIDADGEKETISWTSATTEDAFLALDLNGNNTIDGGYELFGNHTPQPPHDDPNGFLALAVFDTEAEGGDGDGWISSADLVFNDLLLWTDRNHDGISQSDELEALSESAITAIRLRYIENRRRDEHGNEFRWASMVEFTQGQRKLAAVDFVFLLAAQ